MLTVVCFKWFDRRGRYNDRMLYTSDHVNRLKRMVARNLSRPHTFLCVTDDSAGLDPDIRVHPLDEDILVRAGNRYPKLMVFRPDAGEWAGSRILLMDLDTVIVGPLDPLVDRQEEFVAWEEPKWGRNGTGRYNSSLILLAAGSRPQVWNTFERLAEDGTLSGAPTEYSDQALICTALGDEEAVWTRKDGVLSFKIDVVRKRIPSFRRDISLPTRVPRGARVIFFHGGLDPASPELAATHAWLSEHRR